MGRFMWMSAVMDLFNEVLGKYESNQKFIITEFSLTPEQALKDLDDEINNYPRELNYRLGLGKRPDPQDKMDMQIKVVK